MAHCVWCNEEVNSFLLHMCPDGSTFSDRTKRTLNGDKPPFPETPRKKRKRDDETYTGLYYYEPTPDEHEWLRGMRIKW